ncbi:hypothetical protein FQZ97_828890 [compost metagenome]
MHREHVVAVDLRGRDVHRRGARRGAVAGRHRASCGGGAPAVVLADEEHGQVVHAGPVQRFEERAAVDRAVAEEADRDVVAALQEFLRMRRADRDRQARRDHAVGAQHAHREVRDVHRAALAAVEARGLAEQLAHHPREVGALGQRVAMAAVRGGEVVARAQVGAHACRHRFLPGRQVQRPAHLGGAARLLAVGADPALAGGLGGVLEGADAHHDAVQRLAGAWGVARVHLVSNALGIGALRKIVSTETDSTYRANPSTPARPLFRARASCSLLYLFFLFKLVVVDKGKPALWTGHFFPCLTTTCHTPDTVCSCAFAVLSKQEQLGRGRSRCG